MSLDGNFWGLSPELEDSFFWAWTVLAAGVLTVGFLVVSSSELESSSEESSWAGVAAAADFDGAALAGVTFAAGFLASSSSSELDESSSESSSWAGFVLAGADLTGAVLAGVALAAGFFAASSSELESEWHGDFKKSYFFSFTSSLGEKKSVHGIPYNYRSCPNSTLAFLLQVSTH